MTLTVQRSSVAGNSYGLYNSMVKPYDQPTIHTGSSDNPSLLKNVGGKTLPISTIFNSMLLLIMLLFTGRTAQTTKIVTSPKPRGTTQSITNKTQGTPLLYKNIREGSVSASVLKVDLNNEDIEVKPVLAHNKVRKIETVASMVKRLKAIAGINVGFYDYYATNLPIGLIMIDGRIVASNMDSWNRSIFAIDTEDKAHIFRPDKRPKIKVIAEHGAQFQVYGVNRPRYSNSIIVFTPEYGESTSTSNSGAEIIVSDGRIQKININTGNSEIPKNGFVISIHKNQSGLANSLKIGERVQIETTLLGNIKHAVVAGPSLIKDGKVNITFKEEKFNPGILPSHDRAAIGITENNKLIFIRGHSRKVFSFNELARILLNQGAVQAIACDGGGSSSLIYKGNGISNRAVSNGILVWHKINQVKRD